MAIIHDEALENFKAQLPCVTCNFAGICKYANSEDIKPIDIPSNFSITITCKEQEKTYETTCKIGGNYELKEHQETLKC